MILELQQHYDALKHAIDQLRVTLCHDPQFAVVTAWEIPLRGTAEVSQIIDAERVTDREVVAAAMTEVLLRKAQNPHESLRMPGVVVAGPDSLTLINDINGMKETLATGLGALTNYERNAFHRRQTGMAGQQILRRYEILPHPTKLRFQWVGGHSVTRFTAGSFRAQCLNEIRDIEGNPHITEASLPTYPEHDAGYRWVKHLRDLSGVPDKEVIAERRTTQPHVRCYVRTRDDRYYAQVSMPMIVPAGHDLPHISGELEACRLGQPAIKPKPSRFEPDPLVSNTSIYRYREMFREYKSALEQKNYAYRRKRKLNADEFA